jgi:hypothetical protein
MASDARTASAASAASPGVDPVQREPVTPAGDGRNCTGTKHLAQRGYLNLQVVLLHHQAGPDAIEQFVLGDQLPAALHQGQQDIEGPLAEHHGTAVFQELPLARAQARTHRTGRRRSGWPSPLILSWLPAGCPRPSPLSLHSTRFDATSLVVLSRSFQSGPYRRRCRAVARLRMVAAQNSCQQTYSGAVSSRFPRAPAWRPVAGCRVCAVLPPDIGLVIGRRGLQAHCPVL